MAVATCYGFERRTISCTEGSLGRGMVSLSSRIPRFRDSSAQEFIRVFGEGVKSARGATAILAAAITLETCLERPFTRTTANKL